MSGTETIRVERLVRAPLDKVYHAWITPELIVQWWGAGPVRCTAAEMDVRVDGTYRIANQTPDGNTMWITGTFHEVDPPSLLRYSWAIEPRGPDSDESMVDVAFVEEADGTRVIVRHTRIANAATRDVNLQGWLGCLDGLEVMFDSASA